MRERIYKAGSFFLVLLTFILTKDLGHIWERSGNPEGTFQGAITKSGADAIAKVEEDQQYWREEDVYRPMKFGLKCSYAHGTKGIRTHIDCSGSQGDISLGVFTTLQKEWSDRIIMEAVSLVTLDYYQTPEGVILADKIAGMGGILGGVVYMNPELEGQLDFVFTLAKERNLDLDFHADENGDVSSTCLYSIAAAAKRHQFPGNIICSHCCSLAVQPPEIVTKTIDLVKEAGIKIVSLPTCNLYLQDRRRNSTPYWRGGTKVWELKEAGVPVAFASDNCRDPFFGFGDHDMLEVFNQAVGIAHLDTPYGNWVRAVTTIPAELMGEEEGGKIAVGLPADLILFTARYFSELLSRPQQDRIILRRGEPIDTTLPHYGELDELLTVTNCRVPSLSYQFK